MDDKDVVGLESAVASPPKKYRSPKKKQKNDSTKNDLQKNNVRSHQKDQGNILTKVVSAASVGAAASKVESKPPTPEKKNGGQRPQLFQKKKNISSPMKTRNSKMQISISSPETMKTPDGRSKGEFLARGSAEERRNRIRFENMKIEEERQMRWYNYFLANPSDLLLFDRSQIVVLRNVNKQKPQAQFVCKVCNYYCDNVVVVISHISKAQHKRHIQAFNESMTVQHIPLLTKEQMAVLDDYLNSVAASCGLNSTDLEKRRLIGELVSDLVTANLKGCSTRLFGSSVHGLGLKTSDVNINLQVPEGSLPPAMLKEVASLLRLSPHFENIVENFECEFPYVSFSYFNSGECCSISLNNDRAVSLSILLSKYTPLDPRLPQLASLFRLWGQLTETDKPREGTWPGYAFYLMTIFYLQHCPEPVLPVLNDLLVEKSESESANTVKVLSMKVSEIKDKWKTNNKKNLAALWIGLLKFYALDFNYREYIVSIDSTNYIPRKTRKIFIVDPFLPTRNVARSVSGNSSFCYIMDCLMTSCRYFGTPQAKFGPLFSGIFRLSDNYHPDHDAIFFAHARISTELTRLIVKLDPNFLKSSLGHSPSVTQSLRDLTKMRQMHKYTNIDNMPLSYLDQTRHPPRQLYSLMCLSAFDAKLLCSSFSPDFLYYDFTAANCTGGKKVPKICGICNTEGHLKDECPEEELPPLEPLPPRTPQSLLILDSLCVLIFEKWKQSDEDIQMREKICEELQEFIRIKHPTARLELFGSTKNGFGLKGSDLDICLTFENNKTGEGLDTRGFIEILWKLLKSFKAVQDLLPIATAKVPIVKFTHKATKLEGDISLYNVLAMENSKLLCTYSKIDIRARILGYMMKRFSKVCRIGDASKGSLSSYAYSLLVIYFLQHCDPPVLPVLQELTESGDPPPTHIVEDCNAYFFKDLTKLDQVWPGKGKNTQSVGELWLNLLIFYTEQFDMLNNVVSIRCSRPISKFEKLWISKGIAIEDPFDLSHNLGSALARKMSLYIIKALRKGRNHFGHPVDPNMHTKDIESYYLDVKALTDGEPPNDRGCRICKSIGHKERLCPEKKKMERTRHNRKKDNVQKKETPSRNAPLKNRSDDEDEEEEDFDSESEKGSSDEEEQSRVQRHTRRQKPQKNQAIPLYKRAPGAEFTNNQQVNSNNTNHSPKFETSRHVQGFQQVPPGFISPESNRAVGSQFGMYKVNKPQAQNNLPMVSKTVRAPTNVLNKPSTLNQSPEVAFLNQSLNNNEKPVHIPTIVFNNSKLTTESVQTAVNPVRFPFPSSQDPARPPPGFIPHVQNSQRFHNPVPYPHEPKSSGQNTWAFEGMPFFVTTSMTNLPIEYVRSVPMYASSTPTSSLASSVASPRPSLGAAFNALQYTGMLGPTEQLIWGQSPPPPTQLPAFRSTVTTFAETAPINNLNVSMAKIQLNTTTSPNQNVSSLMDMPREELKATQNDFSKKESELNPAISKPA